MSRIISKLSFERPGREGVEAALRRAEEYFTQRSKVPTRSDSISGMHGLFQGLVVCHESEPTRVAQDPASGSLLVFDGQPLLDDSLADSTALLECYLKLGIHDLAASLDGGWVLVIVDPRENVVHVVRDHIGLKPVYVAPSNEEVCISSSVGALLHAGWLERSINPSVIAKYATSYYRAVYGRKESFVDGVELVQPGTVLTASRDGIKREQYWDLDPDAGYFNWNEQTAEDEFRRHLLSMMDRQVAARQDEELYIALSGGVDSGSIAGLLHTVKGKRAHAVSMVYDIDTEFDESALMRCSVRDHINNWHQVCLTDDQLLEDLPALYERFDLPLATISIYGYDYLYRSAALWGAHTILTGSGSDYLQGGNYTNFLYALADYKLRDEKMFEHELACWIKHHSTERYPKSRETIETFFSTHVDLSTPGRLLPGTSLLAHDLLDNDFLSTAGELGGSVVPSYGSFMRSYTVQEYRYEAVAPGTEAEDVIDWTWGTNVVSPFFAKDVVEFGWRIPLEFKIRDGVNKVLARRALRGICSNEILDRIDKSGFNAPFDQWIRGALRDFCMDIFHSQRFRERDIYNKDRIRGIIDEHMAGKSSHMMLLWQALNLELWLRQWIDG